ncbi:MAG: hypothetical protein OYL92_03600 [Acidobacteriota bacterium]|nr:hypothetical protein [Acidobacteriota bacterium]MDE3264034.1 hypothetical protein [Acidobacteriota bacterium]
MSGKLLEQPGRFIPPGHPPVARDIGDGGGNGNGSGSGNGNGSTLLDHERRLATAEEKLHHTATKADVAEIKTLIVNRIDSAVDRLSSRQWIMLGVLLTAAVTALTFLWRGLVDLAVIAAGG